MLRTRRKRVRETSPRKGRKFQSAWSPGPAFTKSSCGSSFIGRARLAAPKRVAHFGRLSNSYDFIWQALAMAKPPSGGITLRSREPLDSGSGRTHVLHAVRSVRSQNVRGKGPALGLQKRPSLSSGVASLERSLMPSCHHIRENQAGAKAETAGFQSSGTLRAPFGNRREQAPRRIRIERADNLRESA